MNNHPKRTYSFGLVLLAITLANIISSCACIVLLSEANSSSHVEFNIARQRGPLASESSILHCLTASNHEIYHSHHIDETLISPNLSHMDFLDDPAAIYGSRLMYSCATKEVSSNEHINPEIWSNNHPKRIYSFGLVLLNITLTNIISSCACIVLLSEASSSSHVVFNIARQRGPLAPEPSILPCLTASNYEIYHFLSCWQDLGVSKSYQSKQTISIPDTHTHVLFH